MQVVEAESVNSRIESQLSYFDKLPKFVSRGKYANWNPKNNIVVVRGRPEGSYQLKEWFFGANIVTDDGDIYYAKKAAGESPGTNENFGAGRFQLRNGSAVTPAKADTWTQFTTPITGSLVVFDGTYPKTNDTGDADNTGDTVDTVSYRASWTTGAFNATGIIGGCILDHNVPATGDKLLTHFVISTFDKTASDTLKMFVNHRMNGV
jgi:hypothetical protein